MAVVEITSCHLTRASSYQFPPDYGPITGAEISTLRYSGFQKLKTWCKEHCQEGWTWEFKADNVAFDFSDPQDALLFKLTWL